MPDGEQFLRNSLEGKTASNMGEEILRKSEDKNSATYKEFEHQQELDLLLQDNWRDNNMDKALKLIKENMDLLDAKGNTRLRNWYDKAIIQQKNEKGETLTEIEEDQLLKAAENSNEL